MFFMWQALALDIGIWQKKTKAFNKKYQAIKDGKPIQMWSNPKIITTSEEFEESF